MSADFRVDPLRATHERLVYIEELLLVAERAQGYYDGSFEHAKLYPAIETALTEVRKLTDLIRPTLGDLA